MKTIKNAAIQTVDGFDRIIQISPAWDKRHPDPSKNYGIGGMHLRFVLRGPKGAMQFVFYTNCYPDHVMREHERDGYVSKWIGADIGYHSPVPMYDGHQKMGACDVLDCECYYDGTSLGAHEFAPRFVTEGPDAVWAMLRDLYESRFAEAA